MSFFLEGSCRKLQGIPKNSQDAPPRNLQLPRKVQGIPRNFQGIPRKLQGIPMDLQGIPWKLRRNYRESLGICRKHPRIGNPKESMNPKVSLDRAHIEAFLQSMGISYFGFPYRTEPQGSFFRIPTWIPWALFWSTRLWLLLLIYVLFCKLFFLPTRNSLGKPNQQGSPFLGTKVDLNTALKGN